MNVIDLFAGAGGLSEGFRQAGFNIISHIEMDRSACNTLRTREAYYFLNENNQLELYLDYLRKRISRAELYEAIPDRVLNSVIHSEISDQSFPDITARIDQRMEDLNVNEIDLIIGGPPCQAFSTAGISRDPDRMRNDPRNFLYVQYINFLIRYQPKMFIFENVRGILTAQNGTIFQNLRNDLAEAGYQIDFQILNARNFNVSQNRERVILIGWRNQYNLDYPNFNLTQENIEINALFNDLPPLRAGEFIDGEESYVNNNQIANLFIRTPEWDVLTQHISRPNNANDLEIYRRVVEIWNSDQRFLKYNELPLSLQTHNNKASFLDRYKLIPSNGISHTVVAHISKDGHYYIHPDLNQNRSISVREAARIQSFPDNFYFEDSRTAAFKQIGNAVPPLMAFHIAQHIHQTLQEIE